MDIIHADRDLLQFFFFFVVQQLDSTMRIILLQLKDGAYYCYCAYVLRISRNSGFLSVMLTNSGIFLRSLKLSGESRS